MEPYSIRAPVKAMTAQANKLNNRFTEHDQSKMRIIPLITLHLLIITPCKSHQNCQKLEPQYLQP